jgi:hypothetical protein
MLLRSSRLSERYGSVRPANETSRLQDADRSLCGIFRCGHHRTAGAPGPIHGFHGDLSDAARRLYDSELHADLSRFCLLLYSEWSERQWDDQIMPDPLDDRSIPAALGISQRVKELLLATVACAVGIFLALWATRDLSPGLNLQDLPNLQSCISANLQTLKPQNLQAETLSDLSKLCYDQITYQGRLNDYQLKRMPIVQQYYSNPVLLWMVVIITFSGVVLAGTQLLASFQLASTRGQDFGQGGSITVERNKFVMQSSVTGLFVLVISFAFFLVFIKYVYRIEEIDPDHPAGYSTTQQSQQLLPGGLGPAPVDPPATDKKPPPAPPQ